MAGGDHRGNEKDRVPTDQAVLDETILEGLTPVRTTPAERDESSSAGGYGSDPSDH